MTWPYGGRIGLLDPRPCYTARLQLDVDASVEARYDAAQAAVLSGGDDSEIAALATVAVRREQAIFSDDVLARRLRVTSLDSAATLRSTSLVEAALAGGVGAHKKKAVR